MSQPIRTTPSAPMPRQRSAPQFPSPRQLAEQDFKTLASTFRLLSRAVVERTKHHRPDDADTLARQAVLVEDELAHCYPTQWPQLRPQLLQEQADWWAEDHDDDPLTCQSCQLHSGIGPERIDVPRPRQVWS